MLDSRTICAPRFLDEGSDGILLFCCDLWFDFQLEFGMPYQALLLMSYHVEVVILGLDRDDGLGVLVYCQLDRDGAAGSKKCGLCKDWCDLCP